MNELAERVYWQLEWMKYFRVSTVTVKTLMFLFGNRDKDKRNLCERKRRRWNWNNFFDKWYLRSILTSFYLWSFTNDSTARNFALLYYTSLLLHKHNYIIYIYFTPNLFTKYIVIFKIWMGNWILILANLKLLVQKEM